VAGGSLGLASSFFLHFVEELDDQKQDKGDNDEVDSDCDEVAIGPNRPRFFGIRE